MWAQTGSDYPKVEKSPLDNSELKITELFLSSAGHFF
jgi:hypothetical protein